MSSVEFVTSGQSVADSVQRAFHLYADQHFMGVRFRQGKSENVGRWVDCENFHWKTYKEIHKLSLQIACGMKGILNLPKRSFVGISFGNCPEWLAVDFACCFNDMVSVGLHTSWSQAHINFVCQDAELNCVVCDIDTVGKFVTAINSGSYPKLQHLVIINARNSQIQTLQTETLTSVTITSFNDLISESKHVHERGCITHTRCGQNLNSYTKPLANHMGSPNEPYTLMYSSGTTGQPKAIILQKGRWKQDAAAGGVMVVSPPVAVSYMPLAHGADRGIAWQVNKFNFY